MSENIPKRLLENISYFDKEEKAFILKAFLFAKEKHKDQKRASGSPYIEHPLRISLNLLNYQYDIETVIAGLLHDTLEDTKTTYDELKDNFGDKIADIVEGVTKVSSYKLTNKDYIFSDKEIFLSKVDNYRKILLAATKDTRVIIVKLYDRLDNIQTIKWLPAHKQKFYARETIEIFAPIAERLGMGVLKGNLEDTAFPFAYPEEFAKFKRSIRDIYLNPKKTIEKVIPKIEKILKASSISFVAISGRAKHHYSLYKKLQRKDGDIKQIFDIVALRIITKTIEDCYKALGVIHAAFSPHPDRIHDYIARPKPNGYRSIHTTVKDEANNLFEVQIRTEEMHKEAEFGGAAHWDYKSKSSENLLNKSTKNWFLELKKLERIDDKKQLLGQLKGEFFSEQIFVFTPKGDIIDLPNNSNGLDFAYRIHSHVGNHCVGTKINNKIASLSTVLKTGDTIEILTSAKASPKREWLKIANTNGARQHIRNYFRELESESLLKRGFKILNDALINWKFPALKKDDADKRLDNNKVPYKTLGKALIALSEKNISKIKLVKLLHPEFHNDEKVLKKIQTIERSIESLKDIRHAYAGCCNAKDSSNIIGYLTKEHIIKVHKKNCRQIKHADPRRLIEL